MPGWLTKLLELLKIKVDVSALKAENLHVHINSAAPPTQPPSIVIDKATGKIEVNLAGLDASQLAALRGIIKDSVISENQVVIEEHAEGRIEEMREVEAQPDNRALLNSLQPYLSSQDYLALRSALVLQAQFKAGQPVIKLKAELLNRFGTRGTNIANMCSAGYFEQVAQYVSQHQGDHGFSVERFRGNLERFITESAYAFFVKSTLSDIAVAETLSQMIYRNARYGQNTLVIHAFGSRNVARVGSIVDEQIRSEPKISRIFHELNGGALKTVLRFPTNLAPK